MAWEMSFQEYEIKKQLLLSSTPAERPDMES